MTSLPLTKKNLKNFMNAYANKMESKSQRAPSEVSFASTKRSKSTEHARSRSKPKGGKKKGNVHHQRMMKDHVIKHIALVKPILKSLNDATKRLSLAKTGYFADSKDSKADLPSMQKEVDTLTKELKLLKDAFRAGLGDSPIKMRLTMPMVLTTTVTTGVTNSVQMGGSSSINPVNLTEWSSISALFDEAKFFGGECLFVYDNFSQGSATYGLLPTTPNIMPAIGYTAEAAAGSAASTDAIMQLAQHKVLPNCLYTGTSYNFTFPHSANHKFKWHIPRGTVISGNAGILPGTEWQVIAATMGNLGMIQFYHVGVCITADVTGAGNAYINCEFRCRI